MITPAIVATAVPISWPNDVTNVIHQCRRVTGEFAIVNIFAESEPELSDVCAMSKSLRCEISLIFNELVRFRCEHLISGNKEQPSTDTERSGQCGKP